MKEISINEFNYNIFNKFGKDWALIVVKDNTEDNAMTISWGQLGILWSRPTVSVYVRNTRHTKNMLNNVDTFSVCFFNEKYRKELNICGTKSRKEVDKITECKFTRSYEDNTLYIKEANIVLILKKIYQVDLPIIETTNSTIKKHYNEGEYHTQYIGEVVKILINEEM